MSEEKKNKIKINGTPVQVSAKRLTFFDVQAIAPLFANSTLDFSNYWRYAFYNWLDCTPSIDFESLSPEEGQSLAELLPEPSQVMASFSGGEVGDIRRYLNNRSTKDRLRYQREGMEYLLMTHYNMNLQEVRNLTIEDGKQLLYWAQAMQVEEEIPRDAIYLGYDNVPPLEGSL